LSQLGASLGLVERVWIEGCRPPALDQRNTFSAGAGPALRQAKIPANTTSKTLSLLMKTSPMYQQTLPPLLLAAGGRPRVWLTWIRSSDHFVVANEEQGYRDSGRKAR
jgi:hypothetical protein